MISRFTGSTITIPASLATEDTRSWAAHATHPAIAASCAETPAGNSSEPVRAATITNSLMLLPFGRDSKPNRSGCQVELCSKDPLWWLSLSQPMASARYRSASTWRSQTADGRCRGRVRLRRHHSRWPRWSDTHANQKSSVHEPPRDADHFGERQATPGRGGAQQVVVQRLAFDQLHDACQHRAVFRSRRASQCWDG